MSAATEEFIVRVRQERDEAIRLLRADHAPHKSEYLTSICEVCAFLAKHAEAQP